MLTLHQNTSTEFQNNFRPFAKALQYIHLTLEILQSVVAAATNNLALFDCLRAGISTKSINKVYKH